MVDIYYRKGNPPGVTNPVKRHFPNLKEAGDWLERNAVPVDDGYYHFNVEGQVLTVNEHDELYAVRDDGRKLDWCQGSSGWYWVDRLTGEEFTGLDGHYPV